MKRICIYFVALLSCCASATAGPFSIPVERGPFAVPETISQVVISYKTEPVYKIQRVRFCNGKVCWYEDVKTQTGTKTVPYERMVLITGSRSVPPGAEPTPLAEVHRMLALLTPTKDEVLVDFGCGDARFLIEAVKKYGCKGLGIEIDLERAALAQRLVDESGVGSRIKIVHGDSTRLTIPDGYVGVAYLYPGTLKKLLPKIKNLKRFASYRHKVDGLKMAKYGDAYVWQKPKPEPAPVQQYASWGGYQYAGPVCNSSGCRMCNSIRRQLGW